MNFCHLKHSELELQYQKYKGSAVLGGLIVKDDSGSYAVFTEQGSSPRYNGCHSKITRMRRTSSRANCQFTTRLEWKMFHLFSIFQSQNVQIVENVNQNTNGQTHGLVKSRLPTTEIWQRKLFKLQHEERHEH